MATQRCDQSGLYGFCTERIVKKLLPVLFLFCGKTDKCLNKLYSGQNAEKVNFQPFSING